MSRRNATFRSKVGETGVGETGVGKQGISPATWQPNWVRTTFPFHYHSIAADQERQHMAWQFCSVTDSAFFTDIVLTHVKAVIQLYISKLADSSFFTNIVLTHVKAVIQLYISKLADSSFFTNIVLTHVKGVIQLFIYF